MPRAVSHDATSWSPCASAGASDGTTHGSLMIATTLRPTRLWTRGFPTFRTPGAVALQCLAEPADAGDPASVANFANCPSSEHGRQSRELGCKLAGLDRMVYWA